MASPGAKKALAAEPVMLTPRSKIRAMMAQIDEDSDSNSPNGRKRSLSARSSCSDRSDSDCSSNGIEDLSDVPMPRGRLAGRLKTGISIQAVPANQASAASDMSSASINTQVSKIREVSQTDHVDGHPGLRSVLFAQKKATVPVTDFPSKSIPRKETSSEIPEQDTATTKSDRLSFPSGKLDDRSSKIVGEEDGFNGSDSDSAARSQVPRNERFLALVAKQRAIRKAREAADEQRRQDKIQKSKDRLQESSDRLEEIMQEDQGADGEDAAASRALSSQVKPTRKASKRAVEAMNRETQRMSRNMQLAHAATVRKKYTVADLFKKFNFQQFPNATADAQSMRQAGSSRPASLQGDSDTEPQQQTPPTSPISPPKQSIADDHNNVTDESIENLETVVNLLDGAQPDADRADEELPCIDDMFSRTNLAKGVNGREISEVNHLSATNPAPDTGVKGNTAVNIKSGSASHNGKAVLHSDMKNFRVALTNHQTRNTNDDLYSSESDLEIAPLDPLRVKLDKAWKRKPDKSKGGDSSIHLKTLAHLSSPSKHDKRYSKASIPAGQMMAELQKQARRQAALHRAERIEELRAKGVIIQSPEERERDQMHTEDLLEKARREVEELTKREREERKKDGIDDETNNLVNLDDSDDGSYVRSDDEDQNEEETVELDISGSDEDAEDSANEDEDLHQLFDNEANESSNDEDQLESKIELSPSDMTTLEVQATTGGVRPRRGRVNRIIDDEDEEPIVPSIANLDTVEGSPASPAVVNPFMAANKTPFFGAGPMGLSQAFAATMDDSQDVNEDDISSPLPMPEPDLPVVDRNRLVLENSPLPGMGTTFFSPPATQADHDVHSPGGTQMSEMPEPTQDTGIQAISPLANRFASILPSTVDTIIVSDVHKATNEATTKKGKLIRRSEKISNVYESDRELEGDIVSKAANDEATRDAGDAFTAMYRAEKRRMMQEAFDKKRSKAKEMFQEQAEESEDEYAGLGGASDDDSDEELDEETKKMMDDGQVELNESQLAAFHADKERIADEKAVVKLYKDINNGALRRKRGAVGGFDDLSDSDEEIERRRRIKRAENARMRKALLADENVVKIAENPKKAAFLKAIEDREDSQDFGFLDDVEIPTGLHREDSLQEVPDSQPSTENPTVHGGPSSPSGKRKRPLEELDPNVRPPPTARRTAAAADRKPYTLAEIRESLSFLIEEPHRQAEVQVAATQSFDVEEDQQSSRFASRRQVTSIVDRLVLKRAESADVAASKSHERQAFHRERRDTAFTVPSLRKFNTNESSVSEVSYTTERMAGAKGRANGEYIRRGGTKKSSVAFYAREAEKRHAVDRVEKQRDVERKKMTAGRRGLLKGLGKVLFE